MTLLWYGLNGAIGFWVLIWLVERWDGLKVLKCDLLSYDYLLDVEREGGLCKVVIVFVSGGIFSLCTTCVSIVILNG